MLLPTPNERKIQEVRAPFIEQAGVQLFVLREDLLHPMVSGNKWRKLRYNVEEAKKQGHHTLLTFGGAFSNHIHATAAAAKHAGFGCIGIIRGEEHLPLNHTLSYAVGQGMKIAYLNRAEYRQKSSENIINMLKDQHGAFYLVPEGGSNALAVKGCMEIVNDLPQQYDYWCCAMGTGGTLAGIIAGLAGQGQVVGFPALKGASFLEQEVIELQKAHISTAYTNFQLCLTYHFGGYAKAKPELVDFINDFKATYQIPLDPVYTGKMIYGVCDQIRKGHFKRGSSIIAVHTGGLQGIEGFNARSKRFRLS